MKQNISIILLFFVVLCSAQQEAQYTQYMYNMNVVNPAYVTNNPGILYLGSLYRTQWTGIEGAPKTANVFANLPLSQKTELSLNYVNDQIGDVLTENTFGINYAYIIQLTRNTKLSMGVKAGISDLAFDFSRTNVNQDPSFQNNNRTLINVGAGAFLFSDNYYVGLSSPNFMPADINANNENLYERKTQFYLLAGYIYEINRDLKLKPSTVIKQAMGAPVSFDLSVNALVYDKFEAGISYRYQESIAFLAAVDVAYNVRIGYAYDYNTNKLNDFNNGSHEIILLYNLDFLRAKKYTSPRFY
ncbi:type IX secretion system membrane protein PorP/SprF [Flavobacteriaceae bacterium KMM 6897]|nr:type IX secretion system membrane protein PorP/SprF [Flavobacteriaceae bacterium KMM 6897]MEB8345976.1 type IX secretion system membrane protein PorP/SprF [Flavobacteriaceae bacterium KMM 6898]